MTNETAEWMKDYDYVTTCAWCGKYLVARTVDDDLEHLAVASCSLYPSPTKGEAK